MNAPLQSLADPSTADPGPPLNRECLARTLDEAAFAGRLNARAESPNLHRVVLLRQPALFAKVPVFLGPREVEAMRAVIQAIESVVRMEPFVREALSAAPEVAHPAFGPRGVLFGYDFHQSEKGPQLIEINTNAGGAFLSLVLAESQSLPCETLARMGSGASSPGPLEAAFVAMFRAEWQLQRGDSPLRTIAIVDDRPPEQFLHPEFLVCQAMFRRAGYDARVLAPESLVERGGALFHEGTAIDLVYNRLTHFYFEHEALSALRTAYLCGGVVVTPHPRAHATFADKRLLGLLTDADWLARNGVAAATIALLLASIPATRLLSASSRARLWERRNALFFKPVHGFGSNDVVSGEDLTTARWAAMSDGQYVAQELVPPSERAVEVDGDIVLLKLDVRAYAYDGQLQLLGARLYRGATTNLRTPGGGFAQVYVGTPGAAAGPGACWESCPVGRATRDRGSA